MFNLGEGNGVLEPVRRKPGEVTTMYLTIPDPPDCLTGPVVADGGGLRDNGGKPRFDLIPAEALEELAMHYLRGTQILGPDGKPKYAERNWERGMAWSKCFASMMRHAWKWLRGEDVDAETGTHHMIAAAWNAFALYTYHKRGIGQDDRPGRGTSGS